MALKLRKRSSAVPYKETYRETEEETEGGVQTIPRVREDGEPEPYTSAQIWSEIITHVREHRDDLNGYSAEEEEIQRWAKLFRHEAPGPYDLKLRGPADIAKSPRVRSMIRAAASQLYDARMQVDFQWW